MSGLDFSGVAQQPNWLGLVTAGMDARRKYDAHDAFAKLVVNPQDPQAFAKLAAADPESALGYQKDRRLEQKALSDEHRAQLDAHADMLGSASVYLKNLPPAERAGRLQQIAPRLIERGISPEEIASADLSDAGLDGYIAMATQAKDALANYNKQNEPRVLNDGAQLYQGGKLIAENGRDAKWIFDAESGSWLKEPGSGGGGYTPAPSAPAAPGDSGGTFTRMIGAESAGRQFTNGNVTTSPKGALGIAQIMPGTAPEAAALAGLPYDPERLKTDAVYNRQLGEAYFNKQVADFGGDPAKAAAAYNAGPGRVRKAIERGGENWLAHVPAETQNYVAKVTGGSAPMQSSPDVIHVRPARQKERAAPSGYQWSGNRLVPIPGGPADPSTSTARNVESNRKAEANFRKEFDQLPEVKTFKTARQQFNTLRDLGMKKNPTPQDDIAMVFNFMKTLDPSSVVREGEFATAQNAAGVSDNVRNAYNKALNGTRLNPEQRKQMVRTAYTNYKNYRDAYNQAAENYRGYARDNRIDPDRVARTYTPDKPFKPIDITPTIRRVW